MLTIPYADQMYGAVFSPDGSRLVTLPMDGTIRVLDSRPSAARLSQQQE
ncbi:MAG TPA: hypothetical protein VI837_04995 [Blastocatellia bacterium]|nr:hypothetical protein [Blastocatellia bacterium]